MPNLLIPISVLGLISLALAGCASTKEAVLPQDGPAMKEIYDRHIHAMGARDPGTIRLELGDRPIPAGASALHGYTREAANEIDAIFPRLPNPTLVMYVFPHLAGEESVP
ncbi:MAG: TIGR03751 family conjugal transfer lipoprotein, partial [Deltaproteobacteria bacterium]|nr:TIGR03751 family conjugal transfer lipoprotein [Deltaproteobacteria bacterium]